MGGLGRATCDQYVVPFELIKHYYVRNLRTPITDLGDSSKHVPNTVYSTVVYHWGTIYQVLNVLHTGTVHTGRYYLYYCSRHVYSL